jgi:hypothetical protein
MTITCQTTHNHEVCYFGHLFLLKIYESQFSKRCVLTEQDTTHKGQKSAKNKCNNTLRQKYL